jgi:hypothetical protein
VLKVKNYVFECVNEFKYLGTLVTNNNRISAEINHRIRIANRCYHGMKDTLRTRHLKRETKGKLHNTTLKPVLIYGSGRWTLTKGDEEKLRIFERKVLRRIYGPTREKEGWRIILYDLYKNPEIVAVKLGRFRWLGHLTKANEISPCRKLTISKRE